MRRWLVAPLAVLALVALVGCGESLDDAEPEVGATQVTVEDNEFSARVIQVPPGTEVTWTWDANNDHNVVGDGFQSDAQQDGTFAHAFADPGTYDYRCTLHGSMTGRVIVAAD
ncbi:MAG: hypothetical protein GEU80_10980 [Dehalococcoidia bacterium]|nr:hypothetical protein [Dehalococcoidia bacterium]